jgi:hypothetical protein
MYRQLRHTVGMTAEMLEEQAGSDTRDSRALLVPDVRCATCTSPNREQIESLLLAGYSAAVVKNHLSTQGIETAGRSSLDRHRRHHLTAPGDAEGIVGLAIAQGGRQLQRGKIKMNGSSLAAFVKLQREMRREGQTRASEQLAAQCVNIMLTALHEYLEPSEFHAFRKQVWPDLMTLVESMTGDGKKPQDRAIVEAIPEHQQVMAARAMLTGRGHGDGETAPGTQAAQPAQGAPVSALRAEPPTRPPFPWERS